MDVMTRWQGDCLTVPVNTQNNHETLREVLMEAHTAASLRQDKDGWGTIFEVEENTSVESIEHLTNIFEFETWAKEKGCISLAIVMPESMLDNYQAITPLLSFMHNRARVFFNREDAMDWSIEMKQARRRELLH
ncbi:hypothetical protein [Alteromonas sp. 14N.309.X.WAT.G.H12]|uniref:hypothetical protein n=1 Tax=Alteromonas sp. 14N.309.X.WAT.G.H12 TaxID=3120824 RepID=UPI002FD5759B